MRMINLGIYYESLCDRINGLQAMRRDTSDPHQQYLIEVQIQLVEQLLADYKRLVMEQANGA